MHEALHYYQIEQTQGRVAAIKALRSDTGVGLHEANEAFKAASVNTIIERQSTVRSRLRIEAAATDMLEAAKYAAQQIDIFRTVWGGSEGLAKAEDLLRAAIKRAEG